LFAVWLAVNVWARVSDRFTPPGSVVILICLYAAGAWLILCDWRKRPAPVSALNPFWKWVIVGLAVVLLVIVQ
jgi:hypothetical protein